MANVDGPKGFWPAYHLSGGEIRPRPYKMSAGITLYKGDVLEIEATGTVAMGDAGDGVQVIGVAAETKTSAASSVSTDIMVYDDPNIVFSAQADDASSATITYTAIGGTIDHLATAGTTGAEISNHELDTSTLNASSAAAAQFLIIDKVQSPDNNWAQTCVKLLVRMNEHKYKGAGVAGI
jgi:hypothetical protein